MACVLLPCAGLPLNFYCFESNTALIGETAPNLDLVDGSAFTPGAPGVMDHGQRADHHDQCQEFRPAMYAAE